MLLIFVRKKLVLQNTLCYNKTHFQVIKTLCVELCKTNTTWLQEMIGFEYFTLDGS